MIKQKNPSGTYRPSYDRTPRYTVKQVAEMMEMSAYTIRYYENAGLIPDVDRSGGNARMFPTTPWGGSAWSTASG